MKSLKEGAESSPRGIIRPLLDDLKWPTSVVSYTCRFYSFTWRKNELPALYTALAPLKPRNIFSDNSQRMNLVKNSDFNLVPVQRRSILGDS